MTAPATGTAPGVVPGRVVGAVRTVLHGVSQIFFLENAGSGLLIVAALAVAHPWSAALAVLGSALQALTGWALGQGEAVRQGLQGFNGALVGAAAAVALGVPVGAAVLATLLGAPACAAVQALVGRLFATRIPSAAGLPVSTAPFCIVAGLLTALLAETGGAAPTVSSAAAPWPGLGLGLLNEFAEVVLADGAVPGVLVLVALFVGSRRVGAAGLVGAVLAAPAAALAGHDLEQVSTGLFGYSAVLVAIAVGAVLEGLGSWRRRGVLVVVGVALTVLFQRMLSGTPVPVYTWPFLLAMWTVLLGARALHRAGPPGGPAGGA